MSETNETPKADEPRYEGAKPEWVFLGRHLRYDLYFRPDENDVCALRGYGWESFLPEPHIEAYRRALLRGLLPDDPLARRMAELELEVRQLKMINRIRAADRARIAELEAEVERLRAELKRIIGTTVEAKVTYSAPPPAEPY